MHQHSLGMLTERSVAAARTARGADHEPDAQTLNGETARRKQRSDWMTDRPSVANSAGPERGFANNTLQNTDGEKSHEQTPCTARLGGLTGTSLPRPVITQPHRPPCISTGPVPRIRTGSKRRT